MKTIGLVGGTTPESTKIYYEGLIDGARRPGGNPLHNPEIIIYSLNLAELVRLQRDGERSEVVDFLLDVLQRLQRAGAEIGSFTANTPHTYLDEILPRTTLPLVSIVSATRDAAREGGFRRSLLLGTRTTMEAEMYPHAFAGGAGIEIVLPHEEDRVFIDHTIYNDLALGRVSPEIRQRYLEICANHIEADAVDSVILGCTEIPLVISAEDLPVAVLDTTEVHVRAILEAAS
jgi:aspartate racemase